MESTLKIRLNVCKSWGCPNLGLADAEDYRFPVYRLGYSALECQKCGGLPPLFQEDECNRWFARLMRQKLGDCGHGCPCCFETSLIRCGKTRAGSQRLQCATCKTIFTPQPALPRQLSTISVLLKELNIGIIPADTPHYRTLEKAVIWCEQHLQTQTSPRQIATVKWVFPFKGQHEEQRLYVLVSADPHSGRVLQMTTNYSPWSAGPSLRYGGSTFPAEERFTGHDVESVRQREAVFLHRSQFDEIHYGSALLKRNDKGHILRPAIAIHGHFQCLRRRFPDVTDHYLDHECVLRGAAITAWSTEIRSGTTHLWFVAEPRHESAKISASFRHTANWQLGWWKNHWQAWQSEQSSKMVALLTGQTHPDTVENQSLASCHAFINWLSRHPWSHNARKLSPHAIGSHLVCLAWCYNQQLISGNTTE